MEKNPIAEIWRPFPGVEDRYEVSNLGRVRHRKTRRIRRFGATPPQYPQLLVKTADVWAKFYVHQAVCEAFHGPRPSPLHQAAHRNGVSTNCAESNLRWATRIENAADAAVHGTRAEGQRVGTAKLTPDDVRRIRADPRSQRLIAADYGIGQMQVSRIKRREEWKHLP